MKSGAVYIMANRKNGAMYTGSTSKLVQRTYQHREGLIEGFTKAHGCKQLVWFEVHGDLQEARLRELQIKRWKRSWKVRMIEETSPRLAGFVVRDSGLMKICSVGTMFRPQEMGPCLRRGTTSVRL